MKKIKKIVSLLLVMAMMFAMTTTAFAADAYKLTITGTVTGHKYAVYQIFTGDVSKEDDKLVLANVKYGENYTPGETEVGDNVPEAELESLTEEFAQTVVVEGTAIQTVDSTAEKTVITNLSAGYYLVKDAKEVTGTDSYTKFILQVVGDTSIAVKSDVPTVIKKVQEDDKAVTETTDNRLPGYDILDNYNDVADYSIGEAVPFELIGTLPSNYEDYKTYKYVFHDTLSAGLAYNGDAKVYVDNTETENLFTVKYEGNALTIEAADLKTNGAITKDSKIVVKYTATLTSDATIGLNGNENKVYLEFSNNPNKDGSGNTGTTPEDKVIVFTYALDVNKVAADNANAKLEGAEFVLLNAAENGKEALVVEGKFAGWADKRPTLITDTNGLISIAGLDDGTYYLKETKAPVGYNLLEAPVKVEIIATTINNQKWAGDAKEAFKALAVEVDDKAAGDGTLADGKVSIKVENNKGAILPSTGGIGTTVFYAAGIVMMFGAAVSIYSRKREEF